MIVFSEERDHRLISRGYVMAHLGEAAVQLEFFDELATNKRNGMHPNDPLNVAPETFLDRALVEVGAYESDNRQ